VAARRTVFRRVLILETLAFLLVALIIWLDELLDLPHLLFHAPATPLRLAECGLESALTLLLGIGVVPALVALFLYSLYPILRNTYTGVREAAPDAVGAALALGMTPRQILRYVRLPLAAPLIMAGIRTAAVINVGTATLAAFIGAGGLGDPIASGLALSDTHMILSGALPAAALALVVDAGLAAAERLMRPGGR